MQKIRTFLWFDGRAEEAARFYTSVFENSHVDSVSDLIVTFTLEGTEFMALNGGPEFAFTEAVSLYVDCASQEEVDYYWNALVAGGTPSRCGWLKDRFGLSWQIVPSILGELLGDDDEEKAGRAMQAMLAMGKLDIAGLRAAHAGSA